MHATLFLLAALLSQVLNTTASNIFLTGWEICDDSYSPLVISNISMSANSSLPGDIMISVDGDVYQDFAALSGKAILEMHFCTSEIGTSEYCDIPCDGDGDCYFSDICANFSGMACPNKKGAFHLEDYVFHIDRKLGGGWYRITFIIDEPRFCYHVHFQVTDPTEKGIVLGVSMLMGAIIVLASVLGLVMLCTKMLRKRRNYTSLEEQAVTVS